VASQEADRGFWQKRGGDVNRDGGSRQSVNHGSPATMRRSCQPRIELCHRSWISHNSWHLSRL